MTDIPKKYKAVVYDEPGKISTKVVELDTPEPGPGEVLINLTHSGVCHSDLGVMTNRWAGLPYPTQPGQVGGHEGTVSFQSTSRSLADLLSFQVSALSRRWAPEPRPRPSKSATALESNGSQPFAAPVQLA